MRGDRTKPARTATDALQRRVTCRNVLPSPLGGRHIAVALAAAALAMAVPPVMAGSSVSADFETPVRMSLDVDGCGNSPGPEITLEGEMVLGSVGGRLTFSNNQKGTHTLSEDTTVDVALSNGETVTIPKQPVHGGVGGNPFIWIQLTDGRGRPLTEEILVGRCVQGALSTSVSFGMPVTAQAGVSEVDCSNSPGPFITLEGELRLSGVNARVICRNNDNPVGGPHENGEDVVVDLVLLEMGETIRFPKQPVQGGVGGNPWIYLSFLDGNDREVGEEQLLGRCEQLSH